MCSTSHRDEGSERALCRHNVLARNKWLKATLPIIQLVVIELQSCVNSVISKIFSFDHRTGGGGYGRRRCLRSSQVSQPSAPYSSTFGIRESSEITRHYVLLAVEEALRANARKITRLLCRPENCCTIISIIGSIIKLVYIHTGIQLKKIMLEIEFNVHKASV